MIYSKALKPQFPNISSPKTNRRKPAPSASRPSVHLTQNEMYEIMITHLSAQGLIQK